MKADFKVEQDSNLKYIGQSIVVDNMHHLNKVCNYCVSQWQLLVTKDTVGRWKIKEGSIKVLINK